MKGGECPKAESHAKGQPEGYVAWHEWAEAKVKAGYKQTRCKGCYRFEVWTKPPA